MGQWLTVAVFSISAGCCQISRLQTHYQPDTLLKIRIFHVVEKYVLVACTHGCSNQNMAFYFFKINNHTTLLQYFHKTFGQRTLSSAVITDQMQLSSNECN